MAAAQDSSSAAWRKIDRALKRSLADGGRKRVIVTVQPGYRAEVTRALQDHGDDVQFESALIDAVTAEVHAEDILALAQQPWVHAVSDDAIVRASSDQWQSDVQLGADVKLRRKSWLLQSTTSTVNLATPLRETLGLSTMSNVPTGRDIGVAVIDSGIAPVPDLIGRISAFFEVTDRGSVRWSYPYDPYGHGTHIAGLIASSGASSGQTIAGVAPATHLVGFKVLDGSGAGRTSDVIRALDFIVTYRTWLNIHVVNLSLGHAILAPAKYDPLVQAVERATQAGLIVVISAGNNGFNRQTEQVGYTGITSPGNAPSAITVGATITNSTATRIDDSVARFSSRGPTWFDGFAKPDVVAPGHQLVSNSRDGSTLSTTLVNNRKLVGTGSFLELSGTSMAAGVTSGVVALMLDAHDDLYGSSRLTPNAVKALLQYSAIPVTGADWLTQGTGQINGSGAIRLARAVNPNLPIGSWWLTGSGVGAQSDVIGGDTSDWSGKVIWGDTVLSGDLVFYNLTPWQRYSVWGAGDDNIIWGTILDDNIIWGTVLGQDNIIWGTVFDDNIIWGTAEIWATNLVAGRVVGELVDDNIIWGTTTNVIWGTLTLDNVVWGSVLDDNIIWGTWLDDNIIWGTILDDNIIWGTYLDDNIIWGTYLDDNIIWGTTVLSGQVF